MYRKRVYGETVDYFTVKVGVNQELVIKSVFILACNGMSSRKENKIKHSA